MSARYDGDVQDALFMNDGPEPAWWASRDIWLNTPGGTVATEGLNKVYLRLRMKDGATFEASKAEVEVFVGNPSLVMTPSAGTVRIGAKRVDKAVLEAKRVTEAEIEWTVIVDPADPDGPDQPGHRCLIARVYPWGSPKPGDFKVRADQHEAQRNIHIVAAADDGPSPGGAGAGMAGSEHGEPMGPGPDGMWTWMIDTTTQFEDRAERVTLRATWASQLPEGMLEDVAAIFDGWGFRGFGDTPPGQFAFDTHTPHAAAWAPVAAKPEGIVARAQRSVVVRRVPLFEDVLKWLLERLQRPARVKPTSETQVDLAPGRVTRLAFRADLSRAVLGEAHVFHLHQVGETKQDQGGLTLVFVKVR